MMLERLADFRPSPIRVDRVRDKDRNRLYRDCCKGLDDRCEFPYDIRKFPHDFKPDPNRHAIIIDTPKEGTPRVFEDDSECQRKISKRERCEDSECQRKIPKREHAWARPDISTEYKGKSLKGADVWAEIQRRTVLVSPTIGKLRCENERLQAEVDFLEIQKISLQKDVEEEKKRSRDVRISLNAVGKYADFLAKQHHESTKDFCKKIEHERDLNSFNQGLQMKRIREVEGKIGEFLGTLTKFFGSVEDFLYDPVEMEMVKDPIVLPSGFVVSDCVLKEMVSTRKTQLKDKYPYEIFSESSPVDLKCPMTRMNFQSDWCAPLQRSKEMIESFPKVKSAVKAMEQVLKKE